MVFAKCGNAYYEAKIIQVKRPGELKRKGILLSDWYFKVHYVGWSKSKDEFVSEKQIRSCDEHRASEKESVTANNGRKAMSTTTTSNSTQLTRFDITIPGELQSFLHQQQLQLTPPTSIPLALPAEDGRPTVNAILDRFLAENNAGLDPGTIHASNSASSNSSPPTTTYTYIGEF